jgi:hypothetical protein
MHFPAGSPAPLFCDVMSMPLCSACPRVRLADLLPGPGEERTVTSRVRGTVYSATDGSPLDGVPVSLGRIVLAADTGDELLARTETGNEGRFAISRQIRCGPFTLLRVQAWRQGYSSAFESVGCRDVEQVTHFRLTAVPTGN